METSVLSRIHGCGTIISAPASIGDTGPKLKEGNVPFSYALMGTCAQAGLAKCNESSGKVGSGPGGTVSGMNDSKVRSSYISVTRQTSSCPLKNLNNVTVTSPNNIFLFESLLDLCFRSLLFNNARIYKVLNLLLYESPSRLQSCTVITSGLTYLRFSRLSPLKVVPDRHLSTLLVNTLDNSLDNSLNNSLNNSLDNSPVTLDQ